MGKKMTRSEYEEFVRRIEEAETISELQLLRMLLDEYDEDDDSVKELVLKLR